MELIFNDNCLDASINNVDSAKQMMLTFAETIHLASSYGAAPIVRTHEAFWGGILTPGYSLADWGFDSTVDRELRRRVKVYTGKGPFVEEILAKSEEHGSKLAEFTCNGQMAIGLGAAIMTFNPAVSFNCKPWCVDPLQVACIYLYDTTSITCNENVCNLYNPEQVRISQTWIQTQLGNELITGEDILLKANVVLSRVQFTPNSKKQLSELTGNERVFPFIVKHLLALNFQCINWANGSFTTGYQYPCSVESQPTMNQYGEDRLFTLEDGSQVTFTWHSKINIDKWRIYFLHNAASNTIVIPYIGPHLPTVGDPT